MCFVVSSNPLLNLLLRLINLISYSVLSCKFVFYLLTNVWLHALIYLLCIYIRYWISLIYSCIFFIFFVWIPWMKIPLNRKRERRSEILVEYEKNPSPPTCSSSLVLQFTIFPPILPGMLFPSQVLTGL